MVLYWIGLALALIAVPSAFAGRDGWWLRRFGPVVDNIAFGATCAAGVIGFGLMLAGTVIG